MSARSSKKDSPSALESAAAGALAGLAASWVMSRFMSRMMAATPETIKAEIEQSQPEEAPTVRVAQAVARPALKRELTDQEKELAEPVVHYAFGAGVGAVFGLLGAAVPLVRSGAGLLYGAAVWALADEVALPKLGLMKPPSEQPAEAHAGALAAHLVYGVSLWAGTALLEALL